MDVKSVSDINSAKDIDMLSPEEAKEIFFQLHSSAKDDWFPIMYVTEECPHCKGEAHIFENFTKEYLQVRCFNEQCSFYNEAVDEFFKQDDYYRYFVSYRLNMVHQSRQ